MNDYPAEYDQENFDNQYFAQAFPDADSPAELYRQVYKYTNCGAYLSIRLSYIEVIEPDGFCDYPSEIERSKWISCDELHTLGTWENLDQQGYLVTAFLVGSIVEGVDETTCDYELEVQQLDEEPDEFRARFDAALEQVEQEAENIWNDTHGCESCAAYWHSEGFAESECNKFEGNDGLTPIWKDCPDCNGRGKPI